MSNRIRYGFRKLVDQPTRKNSSAWLALLDDCLAAAGSLNGAEVPVEKDLQRQHSTKPYAYDPVPKRDARFPDPYNMGVNAEVFLYDADKKPLARKRCSAR